VSLWTGRTYQNKPVVFQVVNDDDDTTTNTAAGINNGDYVVVQITEAKGPALRGKYLYKTTLQL